jgi:hypothetical protein
MLSRWQFAWENQRMPLTIIHVEAKVTGKAEGVVLVAAEQKIKIGGMKKRSLDCKNRAQLQILTQGLASQRRPRAIEMGFRGPHLQRIDQFCHHHHRRPRRQGEALVWRNWMMRVCQ